MDDGDHAEEVGWREWSPCLGEEFEAAGIDNEFRSVGDGVTSVEFRGIEVAIGA